MFITSVGGPAIFIAFRGHAQIRERYPQGVSGPLDSPCSPPPPELHSCNEKIIDLLVDF